MALPIALEFHPETQPPKCVRAWNVLQPSMLKHCSRHTKCCRPCTSRVCSTSSEQD
jgi:hypothetical protein